MNPDDRAVLRDTTDLPEQIKGRRLVRDRFGIGSFPYDVWVGDEFVTIRSEADEDLWLR